MGKWNFNKTITTAATKQGYNNRNNSYVQFIAYMQQTNYRVFVCLCVGGFWVSWCVGGGGTRVDSDGSGSSVCH